MTFLGFALGIATTLSLTNVVDLASAAAMGTVMSLRITGNRLGQAAVPFLASLVATATGVGGIFAHHRREFRRLGRISAFQPAGARLNGYRLSCSSSENGV